MPVCLMRTGQTLPKARCALSMLGRQNRCVPGLYAVDKEPIRKSALFGAVGVFLDGNGAEF